MPKKKEKGTANESSKLLLDVYEKWLARQLLKAAKGKTGFISSVEPSAS